MFPSVLALLAVLLAFGTWILAAHDLHAGTIPHLDIPMHSLPVLPGVLYPQAQGIACSSQATNKLYFYAP